MKLTVRRFKFGFVIILTLLFPLFGSAAEGYKLVCDEPVYDFGTVDQSAVVTNVFTIRNEGDLTFPLRHIYASCSCTKGKLDKRMIGPGETAKFTAVFKAVRRTGLQKKSLKILSKTSKKPALVLYMNGSVTTGK